MILRHHAAPRAATLPESPAGAAPYQPLPGHRPGPGCQPGLGYQPGGRHVSAGGIGQRTASTADRARRDPRGGPVSVTQRVSGSSLRDGFTLIEMLVAISVGSSIMLTAIALVHTAFTLQSQAQARFERSFTRDRFIELFRTDVHLADGVELSPQQWPTLLMGDGQRVEYRGEAGQLVRRQESAPSVPAAEETVQVEQVQLAVGSEVRFSRDAASRCLILEVFESPASASATSTSTSTSTSTAQPRRLARRLVVCLGQLKHDPQEQL